MSYMNNFIYQAIFEKQYDTIISFFESGVIDAYTEVQYPRPKYAIVRNLMVLHKVSDNVLSTNVRSLLMEDRDINLLKILAKYDKISPEDEKFIFKSIPFENDSNFVYNLCCSQQDDFLFILQFSDLIGKPIDLKKSHVIRNDLLTIVEFLIFFNPYLLKQLSKYGITKRAVQRKGYLPNITGRFQQRIVTVLNSVYE